MKEGDSWRSVKLGVLFSIKHGYAFKGEHFGTEGSHIILTPGNFFDEGGFKKKGVKEKWYSGKIPEDYILSRGDLLVAMTEQAEGLLGSSAIVPNDNLYLHNQRLGLILNLNGVNKHFLYYLFNSRSVRQQIRASCSGVKVRHTSPSRIYEARVYLPPLPAQRKIAAILSAYDDLIENNLRRIKILEEMAQNLYREWFVKFRFPGRQNVRFVESLLGLIPEGWEVKRLAEVAKVNRAQINARTAPAELHYIDISSVSPGQINNITTYAFADAPGRARRIVRHGDILWSCVRPNRCSHALMMRPEPNTIASTGFAVLTATYVPFSFLYLATTTDDFVSYLTNNATGAAYPAVTAATFEKADLLIPSALLLKRFGDATISMVEQIHTLQRRIQNLRRTRDLLLHKLISGELDVSELDIAVPEEARA